MSSPSHTSQFTHAIVRRPPHSVVNGLRAGDGPDPTFEGVKSEHEAYVTALRQSGLDVIILPELESFPDSVFVEDTALVFTEGAVVLRPGAQSRRNETAEIAPVLASRFETVLHLPEPGFVEGGDVLVTPRSVMIGLSGRTDETGAHGLISCLERLGRKGEIVQTPKGVLHFKTACALLDDERILVTHRMARSGMFDAFEQIVVPEDEEAAANVLRINDVVFVGADFRRTIDLLASKGYAVRPLPAANIRRVDAGLSCMSLRWRHTAHGNGHERV